MRGDLVSIITPVRNGEKYLDECKESVINQTYHNWEWIIVDDASTDSTGDMIKNYHYVDERIRYIKCDEWKGRSEARNIGLNSSKGVYFTWLDADDRLNTNMIEVLVTAMNDTKTDIAICKVGELGSEKGNCTKTDTVEKKRYRVLSKTALLDSLLLEKTDSVEILHACWGRIYLYKKYKNILFVKGQEQGEDHYYSVKVMCKTDRAVYVDSELMSYRRVKNKEQLREFFSSFGKISIESLMREYDICSYLKDNMGCLPHDRDYLDQYYVRAFFHVLNKYCVCNRIYHYRYPEKKELLVMLNDFKSKVLDGKLYRKMKKVPKIKLQLGLFFPAIYSFLYNLQYFGMDKMSVFQREVGL